MVVHHPGDSTAKVVPEATLHLPNCRRRVQPVVSFSIQRVQDVFGILHDFAVRIDHDRDALGRKLEQRGRKEALEDSAHGVGHFAAVVRPENLLTKGGRVLAG